jgi:hypothetical protein
MEPLFLGEVEHCPGGNSAYTALIRAAQSAGGEYPQIWHLFAFKPEATVHLERWTQAIMRGPSPLSPGQRELIAAFTSARNHCPF